MKILLTILNIFLLIPSSYFFVRSLDFSEPIFTLFFLLFSINGLLFIWRNSLKKFFLWMSFLLNISLLILAVSMLGIDYFSVSELDSLDAAEKAFMPLVTSIAIVISLLLLVNSQQLWQLIRKKRINTS